MDSLGPRAGHPAGPRPPGWPERGGGAGVAGALRQGHALRGREEGGPARRDHVLFAVSGVPGSHLAVGVDGGRAAASTRPRPTRPSPSPWTRRRTGARLRPRGAARPPGRRRGGGDGRRGARPGGPGGHALHDLSARAPTGSGGSRGPVDSPTRMRATAEPDEGNKVRLSVEIDESEVDEALDGVRAPALHARSASRASAPARCPARCSRPAWAGPPRCGARRCARRCPTSTPGPSPTPRSTPSPRPRSTSRPARSRGPVTFDAVVEVRPDGRRSPGYGGLQVTLPSIEVTDEEVDAQVDRLRDQLRRAGRGRPPGRRRRPRHHRHHTATPTEPTTRTWPSRTSSTRWAAAPWCPSSTTSSAGPRPATSFAFAARRPRAIDGPVAFRVLVKDVKEKVLPELTDEWAAEASEFDTLESSADDLPSRLGQIKVVQAQMALRERTRGGPGRAGGPRTSPRCWSTRSCASGSTTSATASSSSGIDHRASSWRPPGGRGGAPGRDPGRTPPAVKADLALRALAEAEELEVTDEELDERAGGDGRAAGHRAPTQVREQLDRAAGWPRYARTRGRPRR